METKIQGASSNSSTFVFFSMCILSETKPCATPVFILDPIGYSVCAFNSLCYTAYEYDAQGANHCHQSRSPIIPYSMATTCLFCANTSQARALTLFTLTRRLTPTAPTMCSLRTSTVRRAWHKLKPLKIPG